MSEKITKRVTEYFDDNGKITATEKTCGCNNNNKKKTSETQKKFEAFVEQKIQVLRQANEGRYASLLMSAPQVYDGMTGGEKKIKGTLAYAGISLNNRLYLPEELAKGDNMSVPLIINHASTAGAEEEIAEGRVPDEVVDKLQHGEWHNVGEVTLHWDGDQNTLFYDGYIRDKFWQGETVDADMAVSLGMLYDIDSPQVCNTQCYTMIKGAEFNEVSLVYHPGFPVATIEAAEAALKLSAAESITKSKELTFETFIDFESLDDSDFSGEAIGPHSREYDYIINNPTSTPEINSINATGKWGDPGSRLARSRMDKNLLPQEELDGFIF